MMIIELRQPLQMMTPKGRATAIYLRDYGPETDDVFTCIQHDEPHCGELWSWSNPEVRVVDNITMMRKRKPDADRSAGRRTSAVENS